MNPATPITALRFPINGIDKTTGGTDVDTANTEDALNVRARSPLTKRMQGGKRAGMVKLLTSAAGTTAARRITGLAAMQRPAQSLQPLQLTTIEVSDDMSQNSNERWALNRYFAFRKAHWGSASWISLAHGTPNNMNLNGGTPKVLEVINLPRLVADAGAGADISFDSGVVIDAATGNDITITIRGMRRLSVAGAAAGTPITRSSDSYECSDFGPFINASEDLVEHYFAYIEVTAANTGKLKIIKVRKVSALPSGGTVATVLAESDEFATGSSTVVDNGSDSATIRLYSNSAKVYATLDWPVAGVVRTLEADVDTGLSTFNRGGFLNARDTEGVSRQVYQARYRRRQEPTRKTFWSITGTMDMPGQTAQPRFATPPDTVATFVTSTGMSNTVSNDGSTWNTITPEPNHPYLDCLGNCLSALQDTTTGTINQTVGIGALAFPMFCTSKTYDAAKTYSPEFLLFWDRQRVPDGATTITNPPAFPVRDEVTVLLRMDHADRRTGLALSFRRKYLTNYQNTTVMRLSSDHFLEWRLFEFNLTTATKTTINSGISFVDSWLYPYPAAAGASASYVGHTGTLTNNAASVFNVNDWIRVTDSGSSVVLSQNGCPILTISTVSGTGGAVANPSGGISTATRIATGFGFCMLPFEAATGQTTSVAGATTNIANINVNGTIYGATVKLYRTRAAGIRVVDTTQANTDPTPDVGEYDLLIVAGGQPHVAQLRVPESVTSVGNEQVNGQMQQASVYGGQFYVVDGTNSIIVHPVKREVKQWAATDGIFPAGCELVATYRGRLVLGRQPANPTLWFMSRIGKPLDWDFGSSVDVASKPYFGASGAIGQPADPLTALCPFMDDFIIMGCQSSLYIMEGDPGTSGKLTSLNNRIGILGPRAWCYDEIGTLYFVSAGGLYKLDRGSRVPVKITGRKLAGFLDNIDTRTTMVQCSYDGQSECIHVFLTPIDGTASTGHVVYELTAQALWIDNYPLTTGPWAVCEIDGPTGNSRRVLFGGDDGYVRRFDESTYSDDTAAITSRVRFAPLISNSAADEMVVEELQAIGAPASGQMDWYIITSNSGDGCEATALGSAQRTGSWANLGQGWQSPVGMRETNAAVQLVIQQVSSTQSWAAQRFNLKLQRTGKDRKPAAP